MFRELEDYIEQVHREPYHFLFNNCIHSTLAIFKKCSSLGQPAQFVIGISKTPPLWRFFTKERIIPLVLFHCYVRINGKRVDVHLSPEQEKELFPSGEVKVYLPVVVAQC